MKYVLKLLESERCKLYMSIAWNNKGIQIIEPTAKQRTPQQQMRRSKQYLREINKAIKILNGIKRQAKRIHL